MSEDIPLRAIHFISKRNSPSSIETACGESINGTMNIAVFATEEKTKATCPECLSRLEEK